MLLVNVIGQASSVWSNQVPEGVSMVHVTSDPCRLLQTGTLIGWCRRHEQNYLPAHWPRQKCSKIAIVKNMSSN